MGERPISSMTVAMVIGRELAAAGSGAGAGVIFDIEQLGVGDAAAGVCADGFEDVLNPDVAAVVFAWHDGAAIEHDAGNIEAEQGHGRAGDGLIAGHQRDDAIEHVAANHQLEESAITSRLMSEAFMPSVPMVMPSLMAMVLNSMGVPPAARIPSFTLTASALKL